MRFGAHFLKSGPAEDGILPPLLCCCGYCCRPRGDEARREGLAAVAVFLSKSVLYVSYEV